jgi:DNA primase catalytic subunit
MAHIYLTFDFAKDEEKAQQARHKLEGWKQAFRLDKKLLYKIERTGAAPTDSEPKPAKAEKAKDKGKGKASAATAVEAAPVASNADIKLLVRLAFSGHEKLSEQRWVQRIPSEDPFQGASPIVVKPGEASFESTEKQFDELA